MATLIASAAKSGIMPKAIHAGVQMVYSVYSLTATLSTGDIIQWCKLPDGARVVAGWFTSVPAMMATTSADCEMNLGTRGDPDMLLASATINTAAKVYHIPLNSLATGFMPKLTVSDSATTRYTMIESEMKFETTAFTGTKSGALSVCLLYEIDQPG